jgi:hypothetical protein
VYSIMLPFWSDVDINNFDAQVTVANERLALLRKSLETVEELTRRTRP